MAGRKYLRLTRADCLWAARQHHPIYVARRFWPRSRFPAGRYPTIRRAFKRHNLLYPWPVRLPRGHGCIEKAMGLPMPPAARTLKPGERRAAKERKALRCRPIPKNGDRQASKYEKPADIWLQAMRDAVLPPCNGTCSIIENQEAK